MSDETAIAQVVTPFFMTPADAERMCDWWARKFDSGHSSDLDRALAVRIREWWGQHQPLRQPATVDEPIDRDLACLIDAHERVGAAIAAKNWGEAAAWSKGVDAWLNERLTPDAMAREIEAR